MTWKDFHPNIKINSYVLNCVENDGLRIKTDNAGFFFFFTKFQIMDETAQDLVWMQALLLRKQWKYVCFLYVAMNDTSMVHIRM